MVMIGCCDGRIILEYAAARTGKISYGMYMPPNYIESRRPNRSQSPTLAPKFTPPGQSGARR